MTELLPPSCFHQMAFEYGVEPPMCCWDAAPSREGDARNWVMEKVATEPVPPAPAQAEQLCHPVIFWISDFRIWAAEGMGRPATDRTAMVKIEQILANRSILLFAPGLAFCPGKDGRDAEYGGIYSLANANFAAEKESTK